MTNPGLKILLLGGTGQLGGALKETLPTAGSLVTADPRERSHGDLLSVDLTDIDSVKSCVAAVRPDVVVNAAAYTAVDQAQTERSLAWAVNATAPGTLARLLAETGGLLIHYSTDYVFDGKAARPYKPTDATSPLNVYGETKLAGENAIRESGVDHLILRTSMVYGATGRNFATTMIALLRSGKTLRVVDDQISSPTWTKSLAAYTTDLLKNATEGDPDWPRSRCGTYHVAGDGCCSRYQFVRRIAARLSVSGSSLLSVPTTEFPTPAERPSFSALDCTHTHQTFNLKMDSWESQLDRVLDELRIG